MSDPTSRHLTQERSCHNRLYISTQCRNPSLLLHFEYSDSDMVLGGDFGRIYSLDCVWSKLECERAKETAGRSA
jgi:hypothetical protein